jgi:hypothetical protein
MVCMSGSGFVDDYVDDEISILVTKIVTVIG